jgi:hypothetical protein
MLQLVDLNENDIMNTIEMATNSAKKRAIDVDKLGFCYS